MGKTRFSRWNWLTIAAGAVVAATTFQPVIQATVVHPSVAGSIFDIAGYVGELTAVYAPWLGLMLSPGAGARTSALLEVAAPALVALCVIAVAALALIVGSLVVNGLGRLGLGRALGIIGFIAALVVPVVSIAVVAVVQAEMSSPVIAIDVLGVRPTCYGQMAAALVGIVSTVFATRRIPDPKKASPKATPHKVKGDTPQSGTKTAKAQVR